MDQGSCLTPSIEGHPCGRVGCIPTSDSVREGALSTLFYTAAISENGASPWHIETQGFYIGSVTLSLGFHRNRPHYAMQSGLTLMAVLPQLPECWYCRTEHHALLLGHHSMQLLVSGEFLLP